MSKQTYSNTSRSNQRLHDLFLNNPELIGKMADAAICNDIAFKLYSQRRRAGLTQAELATLLSVKQSNISRWETPGYQGYKIKMLSKVARALECRLTVTIEPTKPITTFDRVVKFPITTGLDDTNVLVHTWGNPRAITTVPSKEISYANR